MFSPVGLYHNSDGWIQETACYGSDHRCSKFKLACPEENRIILGQMQYAFKFLDKCVFGVSNCDQNPMMCCKYSKGDQLLSYWENDTYVARRMCSAKQSCSLHVPWIGTGLVISSYVRLSYRCAPEKSIVDMCSSVITHAKDLYLIFNGSAERAPDEIIRRKNCWCKISTTNCISSLRISYIDIRVIRVSKDMSGKRCSSASLVTSSFKPMVDCDPGNLPMREPTDADILNSYQETLTLQNLWKYGENDVPEFLLLSVTEVNLVCNMPESDQQKFDTCSPNTMQEASKRNQESEHLSQIGTLNIKQESRIGGMVDNVGRFNAIQKNSAGVMDQSDSHGEKTIALATEPFNHKTSKLPNELSSGQAYTQLYPISEDEVLKLQRGLDQMPNKIDRKGIYDQTLHSTSEWRYSTQFSLPRRTFKLEPTMQKRKIGQHAGRHLPTEHIYNEKDESSNAREDEKDKMLEYTSLSTFHTTDSGQKESKFPNIQVTIPKTPRLKLLTQIVKKRKLESSWPASSFSSRPSSTYLTPNFKKSATAIKHKTEKYFDRDFRRKHNNASSHESDNHNAGMFITSNRFNREQSFYEHMTDSSKSLVSSVTSKQTLFGIEDFEVRNMKNIKTANLTREGKSIVGGTSVAATPIKNENSSFENTSEITEENSYGKESSADMTEGYAVNIKGVQDETLSVFSSMFPFSSLVDVKADVIGKHSDVLKELATKELDPDKCSTKGMFSFSTVLSSTESSVIVARHSRDKNIFNRDGDFSSKRNARITNEVANENNRTSESEIQCSQLTTEDFIQDNEKPFEITEAGLGKDKIRKEIKMFKGDVFENFTLSHLSNLSLPSSWTSPIYSSKIEFSDSKETVTMPNWRNREMRQSTTRAWGKRTEVLYDQTNVLDEVKYRDMSKLININDPFVRQTVSHMKPYHNHPLKRKIKTRAANTTTETSLTTLAGDKLELTGNVYTLSFAEQIRRERTLDGEIMTSNTGNAAPFSSTTMPFNLNEHVAGNLLRPSMPKASLNMSAVDKPGGIIVLDDNSTSEITTVGNTKHIINGSNAENTLLTSYSMSTTGSAGECTFGVTRSCTHPSSRRSSYPNSTEKMIDSNKIANYVEKKSDINGRANESLLEDVSDYLKPVLSTGTIQQTTIENKIGSIKSTYQTNVVLHNSTVPKSQMSDNLHPIRKLAPSFEISTEIVSKENHRHSLSDNKKPFRDLHKENANSLLTRGVPEDQTPEEFQVDTPHHQSLIDEDLCAKVRPIVNNQSSLGKERFPTNLNCTKVRSTPSTLNVTMGQEISTHLREESSLRISARMESQISDTSESMLTPNASITGSNSNRGSASLLHTILSENDNIESRSQHQSKHSIQSIGASSSKPKKVAITEKESLDNSSIKASAADIGADIKLVKYPFHTVTEANSIGAVTRFPSTFASTIKTDVSKMQTSNVYSWSLGLRAVASFHENKSRIVTGQGEHAPQTSTKKANFGSEANNHMANEQSSAKELKSRGPNVVDFAIRNTPAAIEIKDSKINEHTTEQIVKTKAKDNILLDQNDLSSNISSSDVTLSNNRAVVTVLEVSSSVGLEKITASTERKQHVTKTTRTSTRIVNNEEPIRNKASEDVETPDILNEHEAKIIAADAEIAKLLGKMETSKVKMEEEKEELNTEKIDVNNNAKRYKTNTQDGNRRIVTSVVCGALILLVLVGFIVLIYVRLHRIKLDRCQWNSPSISTIETSDRHYNCYGHSRTASWSTVNNSQTCFFARLSPNRRAISPNRNLKGTNHLPYDKRPEVADKLAYKSRAAILLPNETTRQTS
ncbi:hypothetical protein ACJMK2_028736 [Sinanodonta woodiana]|uniref:Uncharacterized protein n=1 Tax=Sinanodonta woodiana TaxID=1069815 RepID=A0ABD3X8I6_SINWO